MVVPDTLLNQGVYHNFHIRHGGSQQRGHADNIWLVLLDRLEEILHRVVDAQVKNFETSTFEHHADQVLTDIMDIALDSTDNHGTNGAGTSLGQ